MWLKSTTNKTYSIEGKVIPPVNDRENSYLEVDEAFYQKSIKANKVMCSLIDAGAIFVTDKEPLVAQKVTLAKNSELRDQNAQLSAKIAELTKQLEAVHKEKDELEKEARETIAELQAKAKEE